MVPVDIAVSSARYRAPRDVAASGHHDDEVVDESLMVLGADGGEAGQSRGVVAGILGALPHDAVLVLDDRHRVVCASGPALDNHEPSTGWIGAAPGDIFPADLASTLQASCAAALAGVAHHDDVRMGERLYAQRVCAFRGNGSDHPQSVLVLWQDVTESRHAEDKLRESELLAITFQDITHPDDLALDLELLNQLLAGEIESYQMEKRYLTAWGSTVWVLLCVALVRDDEGEPLYFVSQILDITDRKHQESALRDLTSMLAHDLRLPATIISGYTELLLTEDDTLTEAARRGIVQRLAGAATTLEELLDNALTASAIDAHGLITDAQRVDIESAVRDSVESVPHLGVNIEVRAEVPVQGWIDPVHLERVMTNLVSNAVKYGGDTVTLTLRQVDGRVMVRVADYGSGVPTDFVPRLFERFSRSDTARTGSQRGSGLGLHIVRDLMRLNSGSASYESTPGGGSTFVIEFPAAER